MRPNKEHGDMNGWTLFADGEMQSASRPVVSQVSA